MKKSDTKTIFAYSQILSELSSHREKHPEEAEKNGYNYAIISRPYPVLTIRSGKDASIWIDILHILFKIKNPGMIVYDLQFQEQG